MKYFFITIDTEGDNLWEWKAGQKITTENVLYLERFQNLCDKYEFKPVWLTNYEMLNDSRYVEFIGKVVEEGRGECGMHLHAWNTPPDYELPVGVNAGAPYLIEYPAEIMEAKIKTMTELIENRIGVKPVSHRAGRWATSNIYFDLLKKYGYKIDCSVTPGIDWSGNRGQSPGANGSDYTKESAIPLKKREALYEVPVTICKSNRLFCPEEFTPKQIVKSIYLSMKGQNLWIRPNGKNLNQMISVVEKCKNSKCDYIMFMLHSSEMMPGGSPTFRTEVEIERLYENINTLFSVVSKEFMGLTLKDYFTLLDIRFNKNDEQ